MKKGDEEEEEEGRGRREREQGWRKIWKGGKETRKERKNKRGKEDKILKLNI